ncbi:penicillin-binding protein [Methyloceanibacter methanicus]|uniref:Penicillin-binding protein n=1 Tax=Methyloceanibacter methanicus TaxID=1774968 RepID=A0A1E3VY15_9HYPH|nr:PBP1A family penicillin-binding protein [Methyloceanibacter methanicus]ODR98409.1 penicillin-binding protein [Methyloceanibacter methanicus]
MRDIQGNNRGKLIDWLKIDSWIDSGLYSALTSFRDWWGAYSSFFGRFEIKGFWRACNELVCDGLSLSVAGLLVVLAFALPSFEIAQGKINLSDEFSVTFLDRYGNEIGKRGLLRDDSVPLEEIPDHMIKATLATEDRRFFDHFGIDIMGTMRALVQNARADTVVQGGSSLTQQLAKNMFLSPERAITRKIKEAFIAIYLENHYTKPELLKLYFDRAYLGGGSYGVEAAAQYYFNKSIRDVTLAESAMLAGMFKAPTRYAPHVNLAASRARANEVLSNMVEAGYLSEGQVYGARLNPARVVERGDSNTPDYFLDWASKRCSGSWATDPIRIVVARTTVDLGLQKTAETAVEDTISQFGRSRNFNAGALVSMEINGAVRAMVGGKDYGVSQFNRAAHAYRQPGSSFKPYVYLSAIEHLGYTPNRRVVDGYVSCGRWSPKNYSGGYRGAMTLRTALAKSINTVAVKLSLEVDRQTVLDDLDKMGIKHLKKTCSLALGDNGMTPLEHVGAWAVFASGGLSIRPYGIEEISTIGGQLLYNHDRDEPKPQQIFKREAVETLNNMLQTVVDAGTGRRARLDYTNAAGKTGTSSNYRDAWFMGFTGQYVTGVWYGNDNFSPMGRVTGGSFPAQTWKTFMDAAYDGDNIPTAPGVTPHPRQIAERQRLAAVMQQNTTAELPVPPPIDTSKDMSKATRQVLGNIATLLQKAPPVSPRKPGQQSRATQPTGNKPKSNVASAVRNTPPPKPVANRNAERAARTASTGRQ